MNSEALVTDQDGFWARNQPGFRFATAAPGSPEFFREVEDHRYALEPHIPELVAFERWHRSDVLEVGCGIATDGIRFARAGARYRGIDMSDAALGLARRRFAQEGLDGQFEMASATELPFAEASFDLVYSHGVLHHVWDAKAAVAEIRRVLRPGGTVVAMVYHRDSFNYYVNIMLLRRALAAILLVPGATRLVAKATGEDLGVLEGHRALLRAHGTRYLTDAELFLSNNTDGPGNPLSRVYSRGQARALFADFGAVELAIRYLNLRLFPGGDAFSRTRAGRALASRIGWHLYVRATKA